MFQLTVWSLPSLAAMLLTAAVAREVRRNASVAGAPALLALAGCVFLWSLGQFLGTLTTDLDAKLLASKLQYPGIAGLAVTWIAFALTYARRPVRLGRGLLALLCAVPAATVALAWSNGLHGAMWADARLVEAGGFVGLGLTYGWWFPVHVAYSYGLIAAGTLLLVYELAASPRHRRALTAVIAAPGIVALLNVAYLTGWSPLTFIDPTPLGFAVGTFLLNRGLLHSGLLDLSPALHREVLEQLDDGVVVLDDAGRIIDLNAAAASMLLPDDRADAALGVPIDTLLPHQSLAALAERPGRSAEADIDLRTYEVRATRLRQHTGRATVLVFRDVTVRLEAENELLRARHEMERLAYTDALTGLHNRRSFMSRLLEECDRVRRFDQDLSLVLVDIDHFRSINDRLGPEAGDILLRHVAEDVQGCSRVCDIPGRIGGEEFALLLPGTDADGAMRVAERLLALIGRHRAAAGEPPVTASIGVAAIDRADPDWQALLRQAGHALDRAKAAGRNNVQGTAPRP